MAAMIKKKCECCKIEFDVREADVKRGWGRFCSKSCKAKKQTAKNANRPPKYIRDDEYLDAQHTGVMDDEGF